MSKYYQRQAEDRARVDRDMAEHRMTTIRDEGEFRHIRVAKPGTLNMHFYITTVPGYLFYTGDMGAFTFSRRRDMFDFHRIDWDRSVPTIDYDYWAQKCEAAEKHGGTEQFDQAAWKSAAVQEFREHEFPYSLSEKGVSRNEIWREYRDSVLDRSPCDARDATEMVMSFSYDGYYPFPHFYERGPFKKPSFRFRWACWAIAKTIHDYDRGGDRWTRQAAHDAAVLNTRNRVAA